MAHRHKAQFKRGGRTVYAGAGSKTAEEAESTENKKDGGRVHGKHGKHRLDRRARGGRTVDNLGTTGKGPADTYDEGEYDTEDEANKQPSDVPVYDKGQINKSRERYDVPVYDKGQINKSRKRYGGRTSCR